MEALRLLFLVQAISCFASAQLMRRPHGSYPAIQYFGQQPMVQTSQKEATIDERMDTLKEEEPMDQSPVDLNAIDDPKKVIIRLASDIKPINKPESDQVHNDGCRCQPLDDCPVEQMDFRFGVSCPYGTVRCCRPIEPIPTTTTTKAPVKEVDIVTPVSVVITTTQQTPLKTEILGLNQFHPINLPFIRVPEQTHAFNERHPSQRPQASEPFQQRPLQPHGYPQQHPSSLFQNQIPFQGNSRPVVGFHNQQSVNQPMVPTFQQGTPPPPTFYPVANQPFRGSPEQFRRPVAPPQSGFPAFSQQQRPNVQPTQATPTSNGGLFSSLLNMFTR